MDKQLDFVETNYDLSKTLYALVLLWSWRKRLIKSTVDNALDSLSNSAKILLKIVFVW